MLPRATLLFATATACCAITLLPPTGEGQVPALALQGLGSGPYSRMEADVEATVFSIDVLHVSIQYDHATARQLADLCDGQRYTEERAAQIARVAASAEQVLARVRFQRRVGYRTYVENGRENLSRALRAGLITAANHARAVSALPEAYAEFERRGFKEGDEIHYQASGDVMHTEVRDRHGALLSERFQSGSSDPRVAMLGSFFAPGSRLREPLLNSLFR